MILIKSKNILFLMGAVFAIFHFAGCKKASLKRYAITAYDGSLKWEQITKKADWENRIDHEVAVLNDELYLAGGYNPGARKNDPYFEDVWKSADGITWTELTANAPWLGRRGHALITFNDGTGDALYVIGGFSVDEATGERGYNNDVWKSADGSTWNLIKNQSDAGVSDTLDWVARMHHKVVVANHGGQNYLYLAGGRTMRENMEGRYAVQYCSDVWRSTDGITWDRVGKTDYGIRSEHAMVADPNGTLYIQGGQHGVIYDSPDSANNLPVARFYDLWSSTDGENWQATTNSAEVDNNFLTRSSHELVFYKNRLWSLPGKTTSLNHYLFVDPQYYPTWTFDLSGKWAIDSRGTAIDARHNYASVIFKDKIWVFGGNTNRNGQDNDVWAGSL